MAEQEFKTALKETGGTFEEAAYNLKLCRAALANGTKPHITSMKVIASVAAIIE
jgi:hypothetical protein